MKIEGFVIVPPPNPMFDEGQIKNGTVYTTFSPYEIEAWSRHIQKEIGDPDFSILVQRWHDRGYRLKDATLTIED